MKKLRKNKFLALVIALVMTSSMLAACGGSSDDPAPTTNEPVQQQPASTPTPPPPEQPPEPTALELLGLDENLRFLETQKITVEIYDRSNDGGSPPDNNFFTDYIKNGILAKHNIEVEFVRVPRWTEGDDIANLMGSNDAPDVCVTYSEPTINTYAGMGGIVDLYPYLTEYGSLFPNIFSLLGTTNIWWSLDPVNNTLWCVQAILYENFPTATFVRKDWLDTLGLSEPTTLDEFEAMLIAFRDNASTLLGADAARMIPLAQSHDVRWGMRPVLDGFMPDDLSDKDRWVTGALESNPTHPAAKQTIQVYNRWYNEGLMWKDFALYDDSNLGSVMGDLIKAGYVGAFMGSHDEAYRNGDDSYQIQIQTNVGPEASFIAVNTFPNSAGKYARLTSAPVDRKVFIPATCENPVAALLYVDFISSNEVIRFLQYGEEGINHEVEPNGAIRGVGRDGGDPYIINSVRNIDYTITINGGHWGDPDIEVKSIALGYPGVDVALIQRTIDIANTDKRIAKAVNVGAIAAEEGIIPELNNKRNIMYIQAITATPDQFDSVWESGMQDLLQSGLQAIIDERLEKWQQFFGNAVTLPEVQ